MRSGFFASFLCGCLTVSALSVLAQSKTIDKVAPAPSWAIASVDTRVIRSEIYKSGRFQDGDVVDRKTTTKFGKETGDLLDQGYEPFAASAYDGYHSTDRTFYSNEKTWFFRKKLR